MSMACSTSKFSARSLEKPVVSQGPYPSLCSLSPSAQGLQLGELVNSNSEYSETVPLFPSSKLLTLTIMFQTHPQVTLPHMAGKASRELAPLVQPQGKAQREYEDPNSRSC